MCTLFSIFRAYKITVKFQNIKDVYLLCNGHLNDHKKVDMFTKLSYQDENEDQSNGDIIAFYNSCYLLVMNQFVKNKCLNNPINGNGTRPPT
jgi:hypothetical protein